MSDELDRKFPEINYDSTKAYMYKYLLDDPDSPFNDCTHAQIFVFSMALAKKNSLLPERPTKPAKLPPTAFDEKMRSLMRSVMIDENNDVYSISDNTKMRYMCEGYANAGIGLLYMKIKEKPIGQYGEDVLVELLQS